MLILSKRTSRVSCLDNLDNLCINHCDVDENVDV